VSGAAISLVARVIANPTSASVLDALLSDRVLTVGAIAAETGRARSTVSDAVSALAAAGLVVRRRRGRTTIVELASGEVADALEALGRLAEPPAPIGLRAASRMEALRRARTCYDHLAGEVGVAIADRLLCRGVLSTAPDGTWQLGEDGRRHLVHRGVDPALIAAAGRRPLVRACSDWTEHRPHLAGRVGGAICSLMLQTGMVRRLPTSRAVRLTAAGEAWLAEL